MRSLRINTKVFAAAAATGLAAGLAWAGEPTATADTAISPAVATIGVTIADGRERL
jgi:hypothetical protein